jgi:hypothetical protein
MLTYNQIHVHNKPIIYLEQLWGRKLQFCRQPRQVNRQHYLMGPQCVYLEGELQDGEWLQLMTRISHYCPNSRGIFP